jgi:hypothetical protein
VNGWTIWIYIFAVRILPAGFCRYECSKRPVKKLDQLPGCIDVAISRGKDAVVEFLFYIGRSDRMTSLRDIEIEATFGQVAGDMLCKAAASGGDFLIPAQLESKIADQVHVTRRHTLECLTPVRRCWNVVVWMLTHYETSLLF